MSEERKSIVESYIDRIMAYPLITQKRERELARRIQAGDTEALNELVTSNLRLVVKIAHDFTGRGLPLEDLIGEGNAGMMRAARKFNPTLGAKFSSYAAWWIKQSMRRAICRGRDGMRVPIQSMKNILAMRAAKAKIRRATGKEPTVEQVAHITGLPRRTVRGLWREMPVTISLNDKIESDDSCSGTIEDFVSASMPSPAENRLHEEDLQLMWECLGAMDARERRLIVLRYGLDGEKAHTLEELTQIFGTTRENLRLRQRRILAKIRERIETA